MHRVSWNGKHAPIQDTFLLDPRSAPVGRFLNLWIPIKKGVKQMNRDRGNYKGWNPLLLLTIFAFLAGIFVSEAPGATKNSARLLGTIQDESTGTGISSAQVSLLGPEAKSIVKTDKEGKFQMDLPPGLYEVKVTHSRYQTLNRYFKMQENKTRQAIWTLKPLAPSKPKSTLLGTIQDEKTKLGISSARVSLLESNVQSVVDTDKEGKFRMDLPPGLYKVEVTHSLYQTLNQEIKLQDNKTSQVTWTLEPLPPPPPKIKCDYTVAKKGGDFSTLQAAADIAQPGDIVCVRAGKYKEYVEFTRNGEEGQPITFLVYPGETVVIDGSDRAPDPDHRPPGVLLAKSNYLIIRGFEVTQGASDGILIVGSHNVLEGVRSYDNYNSGVNISGTANLVADVVAWNNNLSAGDSDGFHVLGGSKNIFRNCISFGNADDGYDMWKSTGNLLENCLAYGNGWGPNGNGDGNGFKLGPGGGNTAQFCVAYNNRSRGFENNFGDQNKLYNNTGFNNGLDNFCHRRTSGKTYKGETLINNLSYGSTIKLEGKNVSRNNSWNLKIDDPGFISLDPKSPGFLHLSPKSPAIDAGVDVGLPFEGSAPDLGAFEYLP